MKSKAWIVSFMLFVMLGLFPMFPEVSIGATGDGTPSDANIHYVGRWDQSNSAQYTSNWAGAYLRVHFTGTTVKVNLSTSATVNFYAQLDTGSPVLYSNASGTVNLTPSTLNVGTHSLILAARDITDVLRFQGLILDTGATTVTPSYGDAQIEFVGDSITVGYKDTQIALSSYAWKTAEQLSAEHTQIAYTGICLQDTVTCYSPNAIGMSRQFFKLQTVDYPTSPDWNFTMYQPKIVVVNLGTNDNVFSVPDSNFQSTYTSFLQNIRLKYPLAEIFVLRTFGGYKATPTLAAVTARINAGDQRLHYVDTTGWLISSDFVDGTHPTDAGQTKVANLLAPILKPYLTNLAAGATITATSSVENSNWSMSRVKDGQQASVGGSMGWTSSKIPIIPSRSRSIRAPSRI
jgi:lysophospholipase L1-like esterase